MVFNELVERATEEFNKFIEADEHACIQDAKAALDRCEARLITALEEVRSYQDRLKRES